MDTRVMSPPSRVPYPRHARFWLCMLALILVVGTFFLPRLRFAQTYYRYMFVFDITQSMNVADAGPSDTPNARLDFAKRSIVKALRKLPCGSEAGVGIFSQNRTLFMFTPVEVCEHYDEIFKTISHIDWRMAWRARSEVSKGLYSAVRFTHEIKEPAHLVFITDGHEAPPVHPDLRIRFSGEPGAVKGILVGVGGDMPVPIPKFDISGDQIGQWQADEVLQIDEFTMGRHGSVADEVMVGVDRSNLEQRIAAGTEHLSSLKESHLRGLAAEVGHRYHRLISPEALFELLTTPDFGYSREKAQDLRWVLGAAALVCLLLSYLPQRRSPRPAGRAAEPQESV